MSTVTRRSFLISGSTALLAGSTASLVLLAPAARAATDPERPASPGAIAVRAGQTHTVTATTRVAAVTIAPGGVLTAPSGYRLTMTVNGTETGQRLAATSGADTVFVAGGWRGDIVLTVTEADDVTWQQHVYPFRQALYVDSTGVVGAYSVLAAVTGGQVSGGVSGTVADGAGTRVVVDDAAISNHGAVRTAAIADNGATLVVKNSALQVRNGVLPADYVPTVNLDTMESAPWMLAIDGNCRATNLLGNNSIAAYVNSSITSESWRRCDRAPPW